MEMPSPCSRCGEIFELNDMYASDYENPITGSRVECGNCHARAAHPDVWRENGRWCWKPVRPAASEGTEHPTPSHLQATPSLGVGATGVACSEGVRWVGFHGPSCSATEAYNRPDATAAGSLPELQVCDQCGDDADPHCGPLCRPCADLLPRDEHPLFDPDRDRDA